MNTWCQIEVGIESRTVKLAEFPDYERPHVGAANVGKRDWCLIAEQPAPAPHLAHPEGCAALRIALVTVPRVSRSCEHFVDGFDLHLHTFPSVLHIRQSGFRWP